MDPPMDPPMVPMTTSMVERMTRGGLGASPFTLAWAQDFLGDSVADSVDRSVLLPLFVDNRWSLVTAASRVMEQFVQQKKRAEKKKFAWQSVLPALWQPVADDALRVGDVQALRSMGTLLGLGTEPFVTVSELDKHWKEFCLVFWSPDTSTIMENVVKGNYMSRSSIPAALWGASPNSANQSESLCGASEAFFWSVVTAWAIQCRKSSPASASGATDYFGRLKKCLALCTVHANDLVQAFQDLVCSLCPDTDQGRVRASDDLATSSEALRSRCSAWMEGVGILVQQATILTRTRVMTFTCASLTLFLASSPCFPKTLLGVLTSE